MANVDTIKRDLVRTIDAMKKNIEKFKKAKNETEKKKFAKIAYKLQDKKKKLEKALDAKISGLHSDAELELSENGVTENYFRQYIRDVIFEEIKKKKLTEVDIDMDKVFMRGKDQDEYRDEERVEKDVEKALKDLEKDIKSTDLKSKNQNEVALELTLAGIVLSIPQIIKIIGKFVNLLKKIPGLKFLSGDKIIALGDKMHGKLLGAITFALQKIGVADKKKAESFANILFHVVLAILLVAGGAAAINYASRGNIVGATLKGALDAVKAGEIRAFIVKSVEAIA